MSLLFADSFDFYSTITDYWDASGPVGGGAGDVSIRLNTGAARTGIGCLQINSAGFGPSKNIPQTRDCLVATNWNSNNSGDVFQFMTTGLGATGADAAVIRISVKSDGSVTVNHSPTVGGGTILGTSAIGLVTFNTYNSIAARVFADASAGSVQVWVNGFRVLNITGVNTSPNPNQAALYYNNFELMAPGGSPTTYHDDVYCLNCGAAPNNNFLGALKLYTEAPTANASVQWTPNGAGTNYQCVLEIPPDGDTTYVNSSTVGQVDQYVYPDTNVPSNSTLPFVVHCLDERADVGSNSIASVINGAVNANAVAVTASYHIYPANYDTNPGTGVAFVLGDFPINAGPKLTA